MSIYFFTVISLDNPDTSGEMNEIDSIFVLPFKGSRPSDRHLWINAKVANYPGACCDCRMRQMCQSDTIASLIPPGVRLCMGIGNRRNLI